MSASKQRNGGAAVREAKMTQEGAATQTSRCSPLPRGGNSATAAAFLNGTSEMPAVENNGGSRIRVCYLDEDVTQASWHLVPNVVTLKQMLYEQDQYAVSSPSSTSVADHFAKLPLLPPARMPAATSAPHALASEPSAEKTHGSFAFPAIRLSPASSPNGDARPAWVSIKTVSEEELAAVLENLPVHVLTRRRIISVLCTNTDAGELREPGRGDSSSDTEDTEPSSNRGHEKGDSARRHETARDNFLEYFPAHGYAVLCLQAVGLQSEETTGRGAIQSVGMSTHGTQLPCTPVVALAFESTLFTFSAGRFGGEGDVQLIMANQSWPTGSSTSTGGAGALALRSAASFAASHASSFSAHKEALVDTAAHDSSLAVWERQGDANLYLDDAGSVAKEGVNGATPRAPHDTCTGRRVVPEPLTYPAAAAAGDPVSALSAERARGAQQPMMLFGTPNKPASPNYCADGAISVVCSSLVSAIIAYFQRSTRALLIEADQLDELVLQILPSRVDQDDMLLRTKNLRHLIAFFHIDALQKERVLKELLLPAMRLTPFSRSSQGVESYQRSLSSVRRTVLSLCKGRDIVNRANMTLVSGVSARLLSHCNFMDYLSHVHTQITVILIPITIVPNLFAMNVRVPFTDAETTTPFFCIVGFTMGILVLSIAPIVYKFLMYKAPGALATLE
ncbi:conserved hypothetical protein [Leishmania major strain Friedlin]|uniref:Divalent cation transporter n=1 Tax=Leishmania major TaxID=5664 RepID=Q4Q872_LEIMA|nr:conserved hypothetical protein [Leishmania major strain Friedlin]CAG9577304.1 divalent_cation_transporter_-_putative [Leishmania major strain Friedlin]CAJ05588.1 conserved hypothetical protein [Leishmania major strain Friedlin]|eukprot:XP_001684476.1 conserved hypothetical protein [Leishmania major strain Friedlin]